MIDVIITFYFLKKTFAIQWKPKRHGVTRNANIKICNIHRNNVEDTHTQFCTEYPVQLRIVCTGFCEKGREKRKRKREGDKKEILFHWLLPAPMSISSFHPRMTRTKYIKNKRTNVQQFVRDGSLYLMKFCWFVHAFQFSSRVHLPSAGAWYSCLLPTEIHALSAHDAHVLFLSCLLVSRSPPVNVWLNAQIVFLVSQNDDFLLIFFVAVFFSKQQIKITYIENDRNMFLCTGWNCTKQTHDAQHLCIIFCFTLEMPVTTVPILNFKCHRNNFTNETHAFSNFI